MKSPDEIKKGLELCYEDIDCSECPYVDDCFGNDETPFGAVMPDALTLIQQLQDDLQLEKKRTDALAMELAVLKNAKKQLEDHLRETTKKVKQLEAERDETISILRWSGCDTCKYREVDSWEEPCIYCMDRERWEWLGVQKEE